MAMKVTLWCDLCPTLLDIEGFEIEIRTRQILPRQESHWDTKRLHVCGECADTLRHSTRPVQQDVTVKATINTPAKTKK